MPAALAAGQIDAFTAGEPWGGLAAAEGAGHILMTNMNIWRAGAEKVLGVRGDWANEYGDHLERLVRAVYFAAQWCDDVANRDELAEILGASDVLAMGRHVIRRSLGRTLLAADGTMRSVDGFLQFAARNGTCPRTNHALLLFAQMVRWGEASLSATALQTVRSTYRPDLYHAALPNLADIHDQAILNSESFFDGRNFDADQIAAYVSGFDNRKPDYD